VQTSRILRYPIDIISVSIVLGALALQLAGLWRHWPWYTVFPVLFLVREVNLIEHNHMHLTIFRSRALNAVFGWLCHLSNGVPFDSYKLHHVSNHHRYNNKFDASGRDWSSLYGFGGTRYPDKPIGRFYYMLSFPFLAHGECLLWFLRSPTSRPAKGFFISMVIAIPVMAFLFWLNPAGFAIFFVVPWTVMLYGMANNNYDQHHGCKMTNAYDAANNFVGFYYTKLSFNVGLHVAHHLKPSLHWSRLPQYHEAISAARNQTIQRDPRVHQRLSESIETT